MVELTDEQRQELERPEPAWDRVRRQSRPTSLSCRHLREMRAVIDEMTRRVGRDDWKIDDYEEDTVK
jgi:hypothetical protein